MIFKDIKDITVNDFQNLIDNGVAEGKTIEYKQEHNITSDSDKKEFLYDVSSFANASGGDLIFGISENNISSLPENLTGIHIDNTDEFIRKTESLIRDGLSPRVSGIQLNMYSLNDSKYILLIRIPKSYNAPHQVVFKGSDKFYSRATNGKYKLDVHELRSSFILSDTITDRIRKFREDRISKIIADETPITLLPHPKIVLQLIPLSSFEPNKSYDLAYLKLNPTKLSPLGSGYSYNMTYNLDGMLNYRKGNNPVGYEAYVQFFRNGIIETVNGEILTPYDNNLFIPATKSLNYEEIIIEFYKQYCQLIVDMKIELPFFVYVSFIGVKGYTMLSNNMGFRFPGTSIPTIDRDVLLLPEIVINDYNFDAEQQLKPLFDMVWNACGIEKSKNYNDEGKWIGGR